MVLLKTWLGRLNASLPLSLHLVAVFLAGLGFAVAWQVAVGTYEDMNTEVTQIQLQFSFGAEDLRQLYATMNLGEYAHSQKVDFLIVIGIAVLGGVAGSFAVRVAAMDSRAMILGLWSIVFALICAAFDGAEDLLSFVTLSDVQGFPDWIALFYSTLAALKAVFLVLWVLAFWGSLAATVYRRFQA